MLLKALEKASKRTLTLFCKTTSHKVRNKPSGVVFRTCHDKGSVHPTN